MLPKNFTRRKFVRQARASTLTLRKRIGGKVVEEGFRQLSNLGKLHPRAKPSRHNVEVRTSIPYAHTGSHDHTLDVYWPTHVKGPWPVVLYVHGGGFRILSKDTHWLMGLAFARRGYLVFNINYRLAPRHPFPAAFDDCCEALCWVKEHAAAFGGDPSRLILAGESAGANLVTSLALAGSYSYDQASARKIFEREIRASAVMAACGIYEVSNIERFADNPRIPSFVLDRLREVNHGYLEEARIDDETHFDFVDPLRVFERGQQPQAPLPSFFLPCGTNDPLVYDNKRMEKALTAMGVDHLARYYPGELHAFHAFIWRAQAKQCWNEWFEFLEERIAF